MDIFISRGAQDPEVRIREVFIRNHAKPLENTHFICSHPMGTGTFDKK